MKQACKRRRRRLPQREVNTIAATAAEHGPGLARAYETRRAGRGAAASAAGPRANLNGSQNYGELSMKRQRGRGRKPGGGHQHYNQHQPNRALESNGPEVKVRGPASHIYERYLQLARDAASSGDRVLIENYLQHADHYFRMVRAMPPAAPVQPQG